MSGKRVRVSVEDEAGNVIAGASRELSRDCFKHAMGSEFPDAIEDLGQEVFLDLLEPKA